MRQKALFTLSDTPRHLQRAHMGLGALPGQYGGLTAKEIISVPELHSKRGWTSVA